MIRRSHDLLTSGFGYRTILVSKKLNISLNSVSAVASKNKDTKSYDNEQSSTIPHASYIEKIAKSHIATTLKELEDSLIRRYLRGYTRFRTRLIFVVLAAAGVAGIGLYLFREPIKENLSDEVADVASRSLGDESVVLKANEVTRLVIHNIINDPETRKRVSLFGQDLLLQEQIKLAAVDLVKYIINNPDVKDQVNILVFYALEELFKNEQAREYLLSYVHSVITDRQMLFYCQELLDKLAQDKRTKTILADFFKSVLASDTVTSEAVRLGKNVTKNVISDKEMQKHAGDAVWNAGWYSITPSWLQKSR